MKPDDAEIARVLTALAADRRRHKTFCPSEAARRLDLKGWRALMPEVRRVAATLPLRATQKGQSVDLVDARGPIRLGALSGPDD